MVTCDECNGWLNPALAVDAAVQRGEDVLLIQRKYPPMVGYWGLPGGFVERDEDPLDAVSVSYTHLTLPTNVQV